MKYRFYFNKSNEAPQIWSVDEGSHASEFNVQRVMLHGVNAESNSDLTREYPEPKAWLEVVAQRMEIVEGTVHFY